MPGRFAEMDSWTSEQVAEFKESGRVGRAPAARAPAPEPLVAEGDSWFDYLPGTDLIDCLRNHHGHRIESFAKAGDTLENMIYGTGIDKHFQRTAPSIESVLRRVAQLKPRVLLFSGGGNDVAGEEFESYLNHAASSLPVLRRAYLDQMIHTVFRKYYRDLIARVGAVSPETTIVTHGYGYTAPTGEGVDLLFFTFAGPWLRPALAKKGVFDVVAQRDTVFAVIKAFNEMLASVAAEEPKRFRHVDLREMLDPDRDWANELHLKNSAYARVAERLDQEIRAVG